MIKIYEVQSITSKKQFPLELCIVLLTNCTELLTNCTKLLNNCTDLLTNCTKLLTNCMFGADTVQFFIHHCKPLLHHRVKERPTMLHSQFVVFYKKTRM